MTFCLSTVCGFLLIIFQTAALPYFPLLAGIYDLVIPLIVYLGLFRTLKESLPAILLVGIIMDSLSGGPFAAFTIVYFWLFMLMRWIVRYLHAGNIILFPFFVAIGALVENVAMTLPPAAFNPEFDLPASLFTLSMRQMAWAVLTAPFLLVLLHSSFQGWDKWIARMTIERNE